MRHIIAAALAVANSSSVDISRDNFSRAPGKQCVLNMRLMVLVNVSPSFVNSPLSTMVDGFSKAITVAKLKLMLSQISFVNIGMSGLYAAGIMSKLKAGFVFSPTEFAKAGEMPFLQSFRQGKFGKYTSQLDIEDALFDGTPSTWTSGNAEIKELVSILRCASFSGFMTISGKNRNLGKAKDLAENFLKLLK